MTETAEPQNKPKPKRMSGGARRAAKKKARLKALEAVQELARRARHARRFPQDLAARASRQRDEGDAS